MRVNILFILIIFFQSVHLISDSIYNKDGYFGSYDDGKIYGKSGIMFDISSDGRIYSQSGYIGQIDTRGYVYGRKGYIGQMDERGFIYDSNGYAGSIDSDGRIYGRNGYMGQGANIPRHVLAIVFFFFDFL